jgi:chromate reductase
MKVVAFAASNSTTSINKQLVSYAARVLQSCNNDVVVEVLDLNDYPLPLFSVDQEKALGQPDNALAFFNKLGTADAIMISFAEHNGSYTAAYKNLFDWCSRIHPKVFQKKPMLMLSTSPGGRGGASVLAAAVNAAPFFDGNVKGSLSVPSFFDHFDVNTQEMMDNAIKQQLKETIETLLTD